MRTNKFLMLSLAGMLLTAAGCGGGDAAGDGSDSGAASSAEETAPVSAPAEPLGSASISGTVAFTGDAPARKRIRQDPECVDLNAEPVQTEAVIVNENGSLRNVFVYVKEGLEGHSFQAPSEAVVFDQRGCMYAPHVFGIQTGQTLKILNSDPLLHNIHALPKTNRGFNFGMPKKGDERERTFMTHEVMFKIKCDVHPWMGAWAGVLEHPYFAVTGDDGSFSIEGLPAGSYVLEAWHEEFGTQTLSLTVGDGEAVTGEFAFESAG